MVTGVAAKTVVITGSSRGLGLATARAMLDRGWNVMLSSEAPADLHTIHAELALEYGGRVASHWCDVQSPKAVQALLDAAQSCFGQVDAWINNAGITAPAGSAAEVPLDMGKTLVNVNILGVYFGSVAAVRYFKRRGRGTLINLVGRGEKAPVAGAALYGASKAWIRQFTLALAKDEPAISVGTFNPGLLYTELTQRPRVLQGQQAAMLKGLKMIMPLIGDTPHRAAQRLSDLVTGRVTFRRENRSRRLLPFVLMRLLTGRRAPVNINAIEPQVVERETGPLA